MKTKKEVKDTIIKKEVIAKPLTSEIRDLGYYARRVAVGPLPDGPFTWWYPDINGLVDFTLLPPDPDADPPFPGTKALDTGAFIKSMKFPMAPTRIYYAQTEDEVAPEESTNGLIDVFDSVNYTIDRGMYCRHLRVSALVWTDCSIDGTLYIAALPS
jgi:hypothetical protein